jgi:hypothetical protein
MEIDIAALKEGIQPRDMEILGGALEEILLLIDQNPFSERIKFLLLNQDIADKPVENIYGELSAPNCIGTALFIAGVGKFAYPYHAYEKELVKHRSYQPKSGDWEACFFGHIERRIAGAIAFSYCVVPRGCHAGIYLGKVRDRHVLFAQHNHKEKFGPESESRNHQFPPSYYIPRTLL